MTIVDKLLVCIVLASFGAQAQEELPSTNTTRSSLQVSSERSQQMRIEFLFETAQAYTKEQNTPAAIDAYEQILLLDTDNKEAAYHLSLICIQTKDYQRAELLLLELIKNYPEDFTLMNNLAWIYATAEDPGMRNGEKAIQYAQTAMVIAPRDYHIWSTLSEAYYSSGDYEKALRAIKHMAVLASRYGKDLTEGSVASYNEQITKCQRALDTAEAMKEESVE
jgi:tetratricopeptide (TPR) repeat protein